jgi:hypothetical protein
MLTLRPILREIEVTAVQTTATITPITAADSS